MVDFSLPSSVAAAGWIPFSVFLLVAFTFSGMYIRYFRHRNESEFSSTAASVLAFGVTLLVSFLLPVDIFLVSFMKSPDGSFKDWAANATFRETIEDSVLTAYYVLYSLILAFLFLFLPFMYFYFEEKDDAEPTSIGQRACTAVKYTSIFLLLAVLLLLLGAFIPLRGTPPPNSTDLEKFSFLVDEIAHSRGEDALCFILNAVTVIGMVTMVLYTGSGLSVWPVSMIKGTESAASEHADVVQQKSDMQRQISSIRTKYHDPTKRMTRRDRNRLTELEEHMHLMEQQEGHLDMAKRSWSHKCRPFVRPFQVVLGVIGALFGLLLWLSLLLSNIDKAMHSLGYSYGYALLNRTLPNPLDFLLVETQRFFPLDYILFSLLFIFLVVCTVSGIQRLGIWFLFLKLYKIRVGRTRPQALMLLCSTVMYTIMALNVLIYSASPEYVTFGSQFIKINATEPVKCTIDEMDDDECMMSRASYLLLRFFYKAWIFGAVYYWATWGFLAVTLIASFVVILRRRQSSIDGLLDEDDLEDSDDQLMIRA